MALSCGGEPLGEELLSSLPHAEVQRVDGDLLFSERVTREVIQGMAVGHAAVVLALTDAVANEP